MSVKQLLGDFGAFSLLDRALIKLVQGVVYSEHDFLQLCLLRSLRGNYLDQLARPLDIDFADVGREVGIWRQSGMAAPAVLLAVT